MTEIYTKQQLERLNDRFTSKDLEWKVQTCRKGNKGFWAIIVPYVTNRAIMERLDQVFGKLNWQNSFKDLGGKGVSCSISVYNPEINQWITKEDAAEQTDIEPIKGGRSNAMKRAAVQFGIGRYLYKLPVVYAVCVDKKPYGNNQYDWNMAKTPSKEQFFWRVPDQYMDKPDNNQSQNNNQNTTKTQQKRPRLINDQEKNKLRQLAIKGDISSAKAIEIINVYGFKSSNQITIDKFPKILQTLEDLVKTESEQ